MATGTEITEGQVLEALRKVMDPELGINIVDLGLVYDVAIAGANVRVKMTLTTPGCPMHDSLVKGAERALGRIRWIGSAAVELVWDPPWNPNMIAPGVIEALRQGRRSWR
jgi:metal-sulfur cluster biosynthetic enzyme